MIVDAATGTVLLREGPCELRQSPCSTFKIPLALMGFDAGILKDEHHPAWDYLPEYQSNRPEEQKLIDPTSWEALSVVWYSQKLTRKMGLPAFNRYVGQFAYGNRNVDGNPGKDDGLTQSWLMSSLLVSPEEQVRFVQKLLKQELKVSRKAYEMTEKILPRFPAENGWMVTGKTGSGFQKKADGGLDRKMHIGWFVGWATKGDRRVIFAELLMDESPHEAYGGLRAREAFIKALPAIMENSKPARP
jgi:beta-lactamase class D